MTVARRSGKTVLAVVGVLAVGGLGGWAARSTFIPPTPSSEAQSVREEVWATVTESQVGRSLQLTTTVRQPMPLVASNGLSGVVTSVNPGDRGVGETVYAVAGVPVRLIEGSTPFYRDLSVGVAGEDVTQLQRSLMSLGLFNGPADGHYGPSTEAAVMRWQRDLGLPQGGTAPYGELVAVESLPAPVRLGEEIIRGAVLSGGEPAVFSSSGDREFVLVLTDEQARLVPADASVTVQFRDVTWTAVISETVPMGDVTEFVLTNPEGGPVCGDLCDQLPADEQVSLRSSVIVVPEVAGPAIPAAALHTRIDGTTYVITADGEQPVTVRSSGDGIAVVDGLSVGARVRVLGTDGANTPEPTGG